MDICSNGTKKTMISSIRRNIKERRLLSGHEFHIKCWDDDGTRFVKLFRETWKQIPLVVRRAILRFWRENAYACYPLIELSNIWAPCDAYGQVGNIGMELKFRQEAFAHFPSPAAKWVIAHELAHIYQKTCGQQPGGTNELVNEDHANRLAKAWGFDNGRLLIIDIMQNKRGLSVKEACQVLAEMTSVSG